MVNLSYAKNLNHVRASIASFSSAMVHNPAICTSLAQGAIYWVVDRDTDDFAPAKFAGFKTMDFEKYEIARLDQYTGDAFDGHQTRKVIETLVNKSSRRSKRLEASLSQWLGSRLGQDALKQVNTTKWKFIEIPPSISYWAFMATPEIYNIELATKELEIGTWTIEKADVKKGDKALIWKAKGKDDNRGIIALADVLSDPEILEESPGQMKYYKVPERGEPARRVLVKYSVPSCLPIWLDGEENGLLSSLSVSKAAGGSVFKVTSTQWAKIVSLIENSGNSRSNIVLLKEVGKSQHKDGVRIDKAYHQIFNPPTSPFFAKRGATRPIRVTFNDKEFDAEYRFEGTKAKEVDLQRIGFFTDLREEFKKVFPIPRGSFTIRLGRDLNHFIFDYEQVTAEAYNKQLDDDISKSRKDSKDARLKRLAEAAKKPASVQVTSIAYVRNSDVIVEVLERAGGKCESCLQDAPFLRAKDMTPYLEVHHQVPLSAGGDDAVGNAIAVCPNCHRKMHYGLIV